MSGINVERYYSSILKGPWKSPKPVKIIDEEYLEELRERECVETKSNDRCDPHHVQKKSQIRNDYMAIPWHPIRHREFHADEVRYEEKNNFDLKDALIATLVESLFLAREEIRELKCKKKTVKK